MLSDFGKLKKYPELINKFEIEAWGNAKDIFCVMDVFKKSYTKYIEDITNFNMGFTLIENFLADELLALDKQPIIDKIYENIFLGDIVAAERYSLLKELEIKMVISLIKNKQSEGIRSEGEIKDIKGIRYYNFGIDDNRNENIYLLFPQIIELIDNNRNENKEKNILIHCYNAVSRSVTILLAYLIYKGILKDALELVKEKIKKSNVPSKPNIGFMKQLIKYEREILGYNSLSSSDYM